MIRSWAVPAAVSLTALAVFTAAVLRWQDRRPARDLAGRDSR